MEIEKGSKEGGRNGGRKRKGKEDSLKGWKESRCQLGCRGRTTRGSKLARERCASFPESMGKRGWSYMNKEGLWVLLFIWGRGSSHCSHLWAPQLCGSELTHWS